MGTSCRDGRHGLERDMPGPGRLQQHQADECAARAGRQFAQRVPPQCQHQQCRRQCHRQYRLQQAAERPGRQSRPGRRRPECRFRQPQYRHRQCAQLRRPQFRRQQPQAGCRWRGQQRCGHAARKHGYIQLWRQPRRLRRLGSPAQRVRRQQQCRERRLLAPECGHVQQPWRQPQLRRRAQDRRAGRRHGLDPVGVRRQRQLRRRPQD